MLALVCFALGALLGFVGAGGAGLVVALLTAGFNLPVHQAIGTGLAAMCFVTVAGSISHFREGNIAPRAGIVVGLAGALGAVIGANIGQGVPEEPLKIAAGLGLWFLALLVWLRTRFAKRIVAASMSGDTIPDLPPEPGPRLSTSIGLGISGGAASGFLGVGMAPFLQLGLLVLLKLPLRQAVGTTMLTLIFISLSGSISLALHGDVSFQHLIGTVAGLTAGSYLGARYTSRAPRQVLRVAVVATPIFAGALMLFG